MSKVKSEHGKGVEICVSWVEASDGALPPRGVVAGDSCYVIRAEHNGEYIPGKFVIGHEKAYVSHDGEEIAKSHYQVLVDTSILDHDGLEWKSADSHTVPNGAIVGGTDNTFPLYIARTVIEDEIVVGKYLPSHEGAYMPYGGKEHCEKQFEVLCCIAKHI